MAWRPRSLSCPYESRASSAKSAAMSAHSPNCEYCAYVSCTRLTARTDSARSTFRASRWRRAAALMPGVASPATTACRAPKSATSSGSQGDFQSISEVVLYAELHQTAVQNLRRLQPGRRRDLRRRRVSRSKERRRALVEEIVEIDVDLK